ncbi:MAG: alkaline phosphatase, partial [Pseudomonadales bacterium]|nr:alkaline phosphatase [Pseudomonadales bacterium]
LSVELAAQPQDETPERWYASGQAELQRMLSQQPNTARARNIILFVGDGMGISTVTAARIHAGQKQGMSGEENSLSFERFPALALSKTYNTNQQTPDSAGTMTAMMTGVKTSAGVIAINQHARRADCASAQGQELPTFLQQAEARGLATGIVTTTRITHATPAATFAHTPERDWEGDINLSAEARANGCQDIASQLIDFNYGDGLEVAMGGGRQFFIPETANDPHNGRPGTRQDGRNLVAEWTAQAPGSEFVWNREQLAALDIANTRHLLGLFNRSHMSYRADREQSQTSEPDLPQMTETAIRLLQKNQQGFFLMVEAGRIDHAHHAGNAYRALEDAAELSAAVTLATQLTSSEDTLIIVTADHSHTFTIAGYPTRGNPILGKVVNNDEHGEAETEPALAEDNSPYTTLSYNNGRGFAENLGGDRRYTQPADAGRHDLSDVDTEDGDYHQEVLIPLEMGTHAGEDVAIYAQGPWAHLFSGTHEQNYIYHVMRHAAGWPGTD